MPKKITTKSGSVYLIDLTNKTWERVSCAENSGKIRTESGNITNEHPITPEVGKSLLLFTDKADTTPDGASRFIQTSEIVNIEDV